MTRLLLMAAACALVVGLTAAFLGAPAGAAIGAGVASALGSALLGTLAARPWRARAEALEQATRRALNPATTPGGIQALDQAILALGATAARQGAQVNLLAAVLASLTEGLWLTDAKGTVVQHNQALSELVGAVVPAAGEQPIAIVRSAELAEAVRLACTKGVARGLEVAVEAPRRRLLAVSVAPLAVPSGGSVALFRDITELRHLEQVRRDFVANLSHELATPITAIRGYAETLKAGAASDAQTAAPMIEVIHRQSERLSALVADLLQLARLEAPPDDELASREPVDVGQAIGAAVDSVRPRARARQLSVEVDSAPGATVWGNARALEQIVGNLLDNAVKYTEPGGLIRVRSTRTGATVCIEVQDNGIGIEARHLPRLFERFYRVDPGRSRELGGTGLGLSIVKHLCRGLGGSIAVSSEPLVGSTFRVELPAHGHSPGSPG